MELNRLYLPVLKALGDSELAGDKKLPAAPANIVAQE